MKRCVFWLWVAFCQYARSVVCGAGVGFAVALVAVVHVFKSSLDVATCLKWAQ